jgi:hypothetical protein
MNYIRPIWLQLIRLKKINNNYCARPIPENQIALNRNTCAKGSTFGTNTFRGMHAKNKNFQKLKKKVTSSLKNSNHAQRRDER